LPIALRFALFSIIIESAQKDNEVISVLGWGYNARTKEKTMFLFDNLCSIRKRVCHSRPIMKSQNKMEKSVFTSSDTIEVDLHGAPPAILPMCFSVSAARYQSTSNENTKSTSTRTAIDKIIFLLNSKSWPLSKHLRGDIKKALKEISSQGAFAQFFDKFGTHFYSKERSVIHNNSPN